MRKRPVLFATIAVLLIGSAGATGVFLVGSKQRRDDRRAYKAYEGAVLGPIATIRDVAEEIRNGAGGVTEFDRWRRNLASARSGIAGLDPPSFMRGVQEKLIAAVGAYARIADSPANGGERAVLLQRADVLFRDAQDQMLLHRRRLGLLAAPAAVDR